MTRKWHYPDPDNPGFTLFTYRKPETNADCEARKRRARRRAQDLEEIMSDPMSKYLYEKKEYEKSLVNRLSREPKYGGYTRSALLMIVRSRMNNDRMPLIINKKSDKEKDKEQPHQHVMKRRDRHGITGDRSTKSRKDLDKIERNADEGLFIKKEFSPKFILLVKQTRTTRNFTQKQLAMTVNVTENDIKKLENGELPYDSGLRALLMWKLGFKME